jgi:transposase
MTFKKINVTQALNNARELLAREEGLSPALRAAIELILTLVTLMASELAPGKSKLGGTPPSQDPYRNRGKKDSGKSPKGRKGGGQPGRSGITLKPVEDPDEIEVIEIDESELSKDWKFSGYEVRQVFDIELSLKVTEYRAEVYRNSRGEKKVADFPPGVVAVVQYGNGVRAAAVYSSTYQYQGFSRTTEGLNDVFDLPISEGSVGNFRTKAYELLEPFEIRAKEHLKASPLIHNDETGSMINKKNNWIHSTSNNLVTLFHPHPRRGQAAIDDIGILAGYGGISVHDCYASYFRYDITHALCGAHLVRELAAVANTEGLSWAGQMEKLLTDCCAQVNKSKTGKLSKRRYHQTMTQYAEIIKTAETETPLNTDKPKRGKTKQTKSRNLLERFKEYPDEIMRFAAESLVPFTNNQAERDIRMVKLHGKISGCFRTFNGAQVFCRIRSFISTCKKNEISPFIALRELFDGNLDNILDQIFDTP